MLAAMRLVIVAVLACAAALGPAGAARAESTLRGPVVVVGVPGLLASDLSPTRTPALWRLLDAGASGSLSVRAVRTRTCPADGWLTLNAGARAGLPGTGCRMPAVVASGAGVRIDGFGALVAGNASFGFGARFGTLSSSGGGCVTAVGPGAALAAADPDGQVAHY